eukprot:1860982-Amphidinium_carterae.1
MTNRHLVLLVHIGLCFFWHAFLNTGPCAPYEREEAPQAVGPKRASEAGLAELERASLPTGGAQAKQPFLNIKA